MHYVYNPIVTTYTASPGVSCAQRDLWRHAQLPGGLADCLGEAPTARQTAPNPGRFEAPKVEIKPTEMPGKCEKMLDVSFFLL